MDLSGHEGEIPIPITSAYVGESPSVLHRHHLPPHSINGPPPHLPLPSPTPLFSKKTLSVKYRECLKNHAAAIGGNATDGCGEFMPSGEEGTLEALKCSACHCHRNFHRKEIEGDSECLPFKGARKTMTQSNSFVPIAKKRFRTKFTPEQKEKMMAFAEKVGWKLQKQEESFVQQFCHEIGVRRRVLKVWMHNNKHNLAKKNNNLLLQQ
ncbi:ZF-HD homeobox protein [Apostasia shenzhenica]|uniref:ZF-HD homeobox protein n=1 Tax=Apostasia shenzhenica TaxID=1088818 RepID=A0A2I0BG07_9ASPA|nr:ZF-HD homeobox protein [Apostasia shenzhenica]